MLRPEINRRFPWWSYVGAASGGALGFIIANIPGLVRIFFSIYYFILMLGGQLFGGYTGNRLGAIRDAKGKSVVVVFSELGGTQKAEVSNILIVK